MRGVYYPSSRYFAIMGVKVNAIRVNCMMTWATQAELDYDAVKALYSNMTWSQFKTAIKQDLAARGYTDIQEVSSSYYLQPGERLIAAVSGWWTQYPLNAAEDSEDGSASRFEGHNYNFYIKYMNSGGWHHKFGTSSAIMILKGSNTPSSITRTDEHFTSSSNYIPASCYMSSGNIVYISFQTGIPLLESQGGDKE